MRATRSNYGTYRPGVNPMPWKKSAEASVEVQFLHPKRESLPISVTWLASGEVRAAGGGTWPSLEDAQASLRGRLADMYGLVRIGSQRFEIGNVPDVVLTALPLHMYAALIPDDDQ